MEVVLILFVVVFGSATLMFVLAFIEHILTMDPAKMRRLYERGNRKPLRLKKPGRKTAP